MGAEGITWWAGWQLVALVGVVAAGGESAAANAGDRHPQPVSWPEVFSAQQLKNSSNHFSMDKLWYDWSFKPGVGRQVIRIVREDGSMIFDVMPGDGNAYYINPAEKTCRAIKFGVSILTPDWQSGGEYMGTGEVDGRPCYSWRKGFGIQCSSTTTHEPLLVTFDHSNDPLDPDRDKPMWTEKFLTFAREEQAPEDLYRIPSYCPDPQPLPETTMAEIRRQLTADPVHQPHILLDEESLGPAHSGSTDSVEGSGHRGDEAIRVRLDMENLGSHRRCPYLHRLSEDAAVV